MSIATQWPIDIKTRRIYFRPLAYVMDFPSLEKAKSTNLVFRGLSNRLCK